MNYLSQCGEVLNKASYARSIWEVHPYCDDGVEVDMENWIDVTDNEYCLFDALIHRYGARILRDGIILAEAKACMESSGQD